MPQYRISESGRILPGELEKELPQLPMRLAGVALMAVAAVGWISLLSWSFGDPNVNHAVDAAPRNFLGATGASLADMLFQIFGLTSIAFFLPIATWGITLASGEGVVNIRHKLAMWTLALILISSMLSILPSPEKWLLPHGMGGLIGDFGKPLFLGITGFLPESVSTGLSIGIAGSLGLLTLMRACGLGKRELGMIFQPSSIDATGAAGFVGGFLGYLLYRIVWAGKGIFGVLVPGGRADEVERPHFNRANIPPRFDSQPPDFHGGFGGFDDDEDLQELPKWTPPSTRIHRAKSEPSRVEPYFEGHRMIPVHPVNAQPAQQHHTQYTPPAPQQPQSQQPQMHGQAQYQPAQQFQPASMQVQTHNFPQAEPQAPQQPYHQPWPAAQPQHQQPQPYQHAHQNAHQQPQAYPPQQFQPVTDNPSTHGYQQQPQPLQQAQPPEPVQQTAPPAPQVPYQFQQQIHTPPQTAYANENFYNVTYASQTYGGESAVASGNHSAHVVRGGNIFPTQQIMPDRSAPAAAQRQLQAKAANWDNDAFMLPPLDLLSAPPPHQTDPELSDSALGRRAELLESVLEDFRVKGQITGVHPGPVITLYEFEPARGTKSSRVIGLADDIARSMSAVSARVAVIPGRDAMGIELPNRNREIVYLRELLESKDFAHGKGRLQLALGKTIGGDPVIVDLARMPHLLIAGTTGSGKSVAINTMILSLLYRLPPEECRFIMIDPKMLELSVYDGIPHLLTPVVTDPHKAIKALKWTVNEMNVRYERMCKLGVRNIMGFNQKVTRAARKGEPLTRSVQTGYDEETGGAVYEREHIDAEPMPYIVVVIDEMADLMMVAGKDIEFAVQRLSQMARAAGIHLIMATQRPSVDVITGTIKANFPSRISFQVTSKIDSRTILGEQGAEQLLGAGDMLTMAAGGRIMRAHGPFVSDDEVETIVNCLRDQGEPDYMDGLVDDDPGSESTGGGMQAQASGGDDVYHQAVEIVLRDKRPTTSYLQRRLSIGYNRAASLIEQMEADGIISAPSRTGKREVLAGEAS